MAVNTYTFAFLIKILLLLKLIRLLAFKALIPPRISFPRLFLFILSPACPLLSPAAHTLMYLEASVCLYMLPTNNTEGCPNPKGVLVGAK